MLILFLHFGAIEGEEINEYPVLSFITGSFLNFMRDPPICWSNSVYSKITLPRTGDKASTVL